MTDRCLKEIGSGIAAVAPEVGGALLKLAHSNIVCAFVADQNAETTAQSYRPSAELSARVQAIETDEALEFAGIIHSHPGGMDRPSLQDHRAFAASLAMNPRVGAFLAPIVTIAAKQEPLARHQIALEPRGTLSMHAAFRVPCAKRGRRLQRARFCASRDEDDFRPNSVVVTRPGVGVLPLDADLADLQKRLGAQRGGPVGWRPVDIGYVVLNGTAFMRATLRSDDVEIVMLLSAGYPLTAPVVLLTPVRGAARATRQISFDWPLGSDEGLANLAAAIVAEDATRADAAEAVQGELPFEAPALTYAAGHALPQATPQDCVSVAAVGLGC